MLSKSMKTLAAFVLGLGFAAAPANAALLGSTVDVNFYYPNTSSFFCSSGSAVVGGGTEYASGCLGFSPTSIDITDTQVIVNATVGFFNDPFNGFIMSILSGPAITSVAWNLADSTMGSTGLSFDSSTMSFNFAGQIGGRAVFDVVSTPSAVPLPAALPLLAAGLSAMGFMGWRRKRRANSRTA